MDLRLRRLQRIAQSQPTYLNIDTYIKGLIRANTEFSLWEALRLGTSSVIRPDGSLFIRAHKLGMKKGVHHWVIKPDFSLFSVDPTISRSFSGRYNIEGDYLPDMIATVAPTDAERQAFVMQTIEELDDSWLTPITDFVSFDISSKILRLVAKRIPAEEMEYLREHPEELAPELIVKVFIEENNIYMEKMANKLNLRYASIMHDVRTTSSGPVIKVSRLMTMPIPDYFENTDMTTIQATVPIKNYYLQQVADSAAFTATRNIDYDYLTIICKGEIANIPFDGPHDFDIHAYQRYRNVSPWRPWPRYIRDSAYTTDDVYQYEPHAWPLSWPINEVIQELVAILDVDPPIELIHKAYEKISQQAQLALRNSVDDWGYEPDEYSPQGLKIISIEVDRDYEEEHQYNQPILCDPCYQLHVTTQDGIEAFTDASKIYRDINLWGVKNANRWLLEIARRIDLSKPDYWYSG